MKSNLVKYVIGIIFLLTFLTAGITSYKYRTLKMEFEKTYSQIIVDSLEREIIHKEVTIKNLESKIYQLNDSLYTVNEKIIYVEEQTFEVSDDISEASELLKRNLLCVEL